MVCGFYPSYQFELFNAFRHLYSSYQGPLNQWSPKRYSVCMSASLTFLNFEYANLYWIFNFLQLSYAVVLFISAKVI